MIRPALLLSLLVLASACEVGIVESLDVCLIELTVEPAVANPGDPITLSGGPFSTSWDTIARIGGVDAVVLDVARDSCVPCDSCRQDAECTSCEVCTDCEALCAPCVETTTLVVPDLPGGRYPIVLFNRHGGSIVAYVAVLGDPPDTDTDVPDTDTDGADTDTDAADTDTDPGR